MNIKVKTATGRVLDWMVAKCKGRIYGVPGTRYEFQPSSSWAHGGPLLTEARISRTVDHSGLWIAYWTDGYTEGDEGKLAMHCDRSELVAGLRCLVELTLGPEVDVPEELCA